MAKSFWICFCWLLIASGAAWAQPERGFGIAPSATATRESKVALVIGNSAYKSVPALRNPANDAADISAKLKALGWDVVSVIDQDLDPMIKSIRQFQSKLKDGGVALFYYAGHGVQVNGVNYILPIDAAIEEEDDLKRKGVEVLDVLKRMDKANSRLNLVVLDACRDNPFAVTTRSTSQGLASMQSALGRGTMLIYAARPGTRASDGRGRNGTFTEQFLANVDTPGLQLEDLIKRIGDGVVKATKGEQVVWMEGSMRGEFSFMPAAPATPTLASAAPVAGGVAVPTGTQPSAEFLYWESIKGSSDPEDYKAYLADYPKGQFVRLAENRIAALERGGQVTPGLPKRPTKPGTTYKPGQTFSDCPTCPEMVAIAPGRFWMGSPSTEAGRDDTEGPQRVVNITRPFAIGKFEITVGQYAEFIKEAGRSGTKDCREFIKLGEKYVEHPAGDWRNPPGISQSDRHPVVCVTWNDALAYTQWLSRKTGANYRLVSEAEWEYAARAGTQTPYLWGDTADAACQYANVSGTERSDVLGHGCSDGQVRTGPIGKFKPNALGLHDMIGNALEWVQDCWNPSFIDAPLEGTAWIEGDCTSRVIKGGGWNATPNRSRVAARSNVYRRWGVTTLGFRVGRDLD